MSTPEPDEPDRLATARVIPMQCRVNREESDRIRKAIALENARPTHWCRDALLAAADAAIVADLADAAEVESEKEEIKAKAMVKTKPKAKLKVPKLPAKRKGSR